MKLQATASTTLWSVMKSTGSVEADSEGRSACFSICSGRGFFHVLLATPGIVSMRCGGGESLRISLNPAVGISLSN